ncbi:MAG: 3-dehydroquinate synthase [Cyanobacteria bacterium]|nr:3-dehydroquinate synthase [Cyanobacteria bacterium CG_2015-16_32_12]NCO78715.1 3-dehydroquinate synthase [Cyanobacteria bacterium CG_2015-22_32_23]NCQ05737.1 3-dehydroquinate synthase [Cyanobacteria bacterium CG_2015-09_32_10]NCQ41124.1 3-dehydroquinate synthase [Cyanobacteria bacterium CG_2015-04_32_10]NCS85355.1 3-dehydroquinate synthase [Cyanobacteria bacterium CG_2015-02_32_10]
MESIISVCLPENSYSICVTNNGLSTIGEKAKTLNLGKKILIISNAEIFDYYGNITVNSLEKAGFTVNYHLIPAGESYKTLDSISKIYDTALQFRLERNSTMLALGGGVVGDMTGFAAATWLRGINFIQIPTSLLGMVDASVGGKTGVNHPQGKNLIGAFYQPKLVLIDSSVLKTLPDREFRAGMAEVIKYGVIWDKTLFERLELANNLNSLNNLEDDLLTEILTRSCQAKADVVSQDEKEGGLRAILNYGHTIGHVVESLTNYNTFVHGEAVAIGMVAAGKIALEMNLWTSEESQRQYNLIEKAGLPTKIPDYLDVDMAIASLQMDKKVKGGKVRFILPEKIGKVIITDQVDSNLLQKVLINN